MPWLIAAAWAVLKQKHETELFKLLAKLLIFSLGFKSSVEFAKLGGVFYLKFGL